MSSLSIPCRGQVTAPVVHVPDLDTKFRFGVLHIHRVARRTVRVSNGGLLAANLAISLEVDATEDQDGDSTAAPPLRSEGLPFEVFPTHAELRPGETQQVTVVAHPTEFGVTSNATLVVRVLGGSSVYSGRVVCTGGEPRLVCSVAAPTRSRSRAESTTEEGPAQREKEVALNLGAIRTNKKVDLHVVSVHNAGNMPQRVLTQFEVVPFGDGDAGDDGGGASETKASEDDALIASVSPTACWVEPQATVGVTMTVTAPSPCSRVAKLLLVAVRVCACMHNSPSRFGLYS